MFNQAKFNRGAFNNVAQSTTDVYLKTDAVEVVIGSLMAAQNTYLSSNAYETFSSEARMAQGVILKTTCAETVTASAIMVGVVSLETASAEAVSALAYAGALVYLFADGMEALSIQALVGATVYKKADSSESFGGEFRVGGIAKLSSDLYEMIMAQAEAEATDMYTTSIDVTLAPGDVLVIDSDHYTVLLNGENILHLHSGDWVWLSRDTSTITIDTGSGGQIDASMLYTERYL